jgi:hypothetical protein
VETGSAALIFFFGLFWASALATVSRYRPFDTASLFSREFRAMAVKRLIASFFIMNVLPVMLLLVLYQSVVPEGAGIRSVIIAAVTSLSVFGCNRILHSVIAADHHWSTFYSSETEWRDSLRQYEERSNSRLAHLVPGVLYLFIYPLLGLAIRYL